jgi:hypothetical protein
MMILFLGLTQANFHVLFTKLEINIDKILASSFSELPELYQY